MAHGHGHGHGHERHPGAVRVGRGPRVAVLVVIALCTLAALAGAWRLWPDEARLQSAQGRLSPLAQGTTEVHARLTGVRTACASGAASGPACGASAAQVLDGPSAGRTVAVQLGADVVRTGLRAGDRVILLDTRTAGSEHFAFYRADRGLPLLWLAVLFALVVVLVARLRGLMALVSLAFAGLVTAGFVLPAIVSGRPPVPVVLAASTVILVVILYATHGPSMRTSVALCGALVGLASAAGLAELGVVVTRLGGLGDDSTELLTFNLQGVDVQQLVVASVVVAGIGTLNDVTVTQASALFELREAAPDASRGELFRRAMRVGRDHVASSVYTLLFAYLGTALVLLVAVELYRGSFADVVTADGVAEDVVRALVGGVALAAAMPITTAIAALVVPGLSVRRSPAPRGGRHSRLPIA